jgi:hypothetical protein
MDLFVDFFHFMMLERGDYVVAWSAYLGAGLIVMVIFWSISSGMKSIVLRDAIRGMFATLLLMPTYVVLDNAVALENGAEGMSSQISSMQWLCPASMAVLMHILNGELELALPILQRFAITLAFVWFLACLMALLRRAMGKEEA